MFIRYLIVFLAGINLTSILWMMEFFDEYHRWDPNYIVDKRLKIFQLLKKFAKKRLFFSGMIDFELYGYKIIVK